VRVKVPADLRATIGKAHIVRPLHTDSLAEANRRKHAVVADIHELFAKTRKAMKQAAPDPLIQSAMDWRQALRDEERNPAMVLRQSSKHGTEIEVPDLILPSLINERAEELERSVGPQKAAQFHAVARGLITPVTVFVDDWLAERHDIRPRQILDYRRAVNRFAEWSEQDDEGRGCIETVDAKLAGRYLTFLTGKRIAPKTINKDLSALRVYWEWLHQRDHAALNPWVKISARKPKSRGLDDTSKRAFTDDEVVALLHGDADLLLHDAIRVAAMSGMRLEEIARLTVGTSMNGLFDVREAKTNAGVRLVPIHSALGEIVTRRQAGKAASEWLFDELPRPGPGSAMEAGQAITKRFVRYRRRLGVDERRHGARQSRIDFHSFRRWFARKAEEALNNGARGFNLFTIIDVLGHDRKRSKKEGSMTLGVYAGVGALEAMRACVEAVKLPPAKNTVSLPGLQTKTQPDDRSPDRA
jgi:integrase